MKTSYCGLRGLIPPARQSYEDLRLLTKSLHAYLKNSGLMIEGLRPSFSNPETWEAAAGARSLRLHLPATRRGGQAAMSRRTVFCVGDEVTNRNSVTVSLKKAGYESSPHGMRYVVAGAPTAGQCDAISPGGRGGRQFEVVRREE